MSKALGMRCVWGIGGVLGGVMALASVAQAEVTTDVSGSLLVYPKVIFDGVVGPNARDTVIQLSNTSNNMVHAHCFYVNGASAFPGGPPLWQITDFTIWLTKQQPTHWVASTGRQVNPADSFGSNGFGLDPGLIPPVPPGFTGELKCVQIDASGTPFGGNNLKGEATLRAVDGDVSKYNAIAILATDLAGDFPANELLLNNTDVNDGEYNACPEVLLLDHFADGTFNGIGGGNAVGSFRNADNIVSSLNPAACFGNDCPIRTSLTLVPCTQDFENAQPSIVTVQFSIVTELEQIFSASTSVQCWRDFRLTDVDALSGRCTQDPSVSCVVDEQCIAGDDGFCDKTSVFSVGVAGTRSLLTRVTPVDPFGGVLGVLEESVYNNIDDGGDQLTKVARASWIPQKQGFRFNPELHATDAVTIPIFTGF